MRILVTGGASCGKSTYAEALALTLPAPRYYIATMRPCGEEDMIRIRRHRTNRADKGFVTIERDTGLASLALPNRGTALLECVCNLTANEMFDEKTFAARDPFEDIMAGVFALEKQCAHLIVVTNEIACDGCAYDAATMRYIAVLGRLNQALAARFDGVCELVCGIPVVLKGELPCVRFDPS